MNMNKEKENDQEFQNKQKKTHENQRTLLQEL